MTAPEVRFTLLKSTVAPSGTFSTKDLQALAAYALGRQNVRGPVELTVDMTGHKRIQELNRKFRGVDRTTDVISFRNDATPHPHPLPLKGRGQGRPQGEPRVRGLQGDLAINVHQAALQAKKMRHPVRREVRLLLIHGILHLLGYTDYEPGPRRRMFKRQNALLLGWEKETPLVPYSYEILIIGLMLGFNAIFTAFEMALASVSQARLLVLVNQKRAGAASALALKERIGASLAVAQVGITVSGSIAAGIGGAGFQDTLIPRLQAFWPLSHSAAQVLAVLCVIVPLSALTIIFGELIPKVFAIENKEWVCLRLAPVMRAFSWAIWPVAHFFEWCVMSIVRVGRRKIQGNVQEWGDIPGFHELHAAVSLARTKHLMGAREEKIVLSAAQLSRRSIQEIILPAPEISMIPANLTLAEALIRAHLDLHTRFPICIEENNPQTIKGYITFKDLVTALKMHAATPDVKGIARPIKRLEARTPISQVLEQMMREKNHIALVVSEEDSVLGLVTMEDIIEELVGDIEDEADSLSMHMHPTSGGWLMGGGVPMNAISSRLGVPWSSTFAKASTLRLADWCVQMLNRPLKKGETLRAEGIQVTVRKLRRHKLAEAFVSKLPFLNKF